MWSIRCLETLSEKKNINMASTYPPTQSESTGVNLLDRLCQLATTHSSPISPSQIAIGISCHLLPSPCIAARTTYTVSSFYLPYGIGGLDRYTFLLFSIITAYHPAKNASTVIRFDEKEGNEEDTFQRNIFQYPGRLVIEEEHVVQYSEDVTMTVYALILA